MTLEANKRLKTTKYQKQKQGDRLQTIILLSLSLFDLLPHYSDITIITSFPEVNFEITPTDTTSVRTRRRRRRLQDLQSSFFIAYLDFRRLKSYLRPIVSDDGLQ